jgi:hypothetical protein
MKSKLKREQKRQRKRARRLRIEALRDLAHKVGLRILAIDPKTGKPSLNYVILLSKELIKITAGPLPDIENYVQSYWDMKAFL